jgi:hypothetical protein
MKDLATRQAEEKSRLQEMIPRLGELRAKARAGDMDAINDLCFMLPNPFRGQEAIDFYSLWQDGKVDRAVAWAVLKNVWHHDPGFLAAQVEHNGDDCDLLVQMFREVGPGSDSLPEHFRSRKSLTIWRGASGCHPEDAGIGLSWTLNRRIACWFATRWGELDPVVVRVEVPTSTVLAYIADRNEEEVIVDPFALPEEPCICDASEWGLALDTDPAPELIEAWRAEAAAWRAARERERTRLSRSLRRD